MAQFKAHWGDVKPFDYSVLPIGYRRITKDVTMLMTESNMNGLIPESKIMGYYERNMIVKQGVNYNFYLAMIYKLSGIIQERNKKKNEKK